jgi:hypothetical protein
MSPAEKQENEDWLNKKLFFSPDDLATKPFAPKTIQYASKFYNQFNDNQRYFTEACHRFRDLRMDLGTSDTAQWIVLVDEMANMNPLLASFEECISQPDYELDVFQKDILTTSPSYLAYDFQPATAEVKMLAMKGNLFIREGKFDDAASIAETILRAARAKRYSSVISRSLADHIKMQGVTLWHNLLKNCDDTPTLLRMAEAQRRHYASPVSFSENENILVSNSIATIRWANSRGIPADIQGKTGCQIYGEMWRVEADYMEQYQLPKTHDQLKKFDREAIKSYRTISAIYGGPITSFRGWLGRMVAPAVMPALNPAPPIPYEEAYTKSLVCKAYFDLLILETEQIIQERKGGDRTGRMNELKDVFAKDGKPYRQTPVFYSVGPDGIDRGARILYDPTNGTISAGDIYFQ